MKVLKTYQPEIITTKQRQDIIAKLKTSNNFLLIDVYRKMKFLDGKKENKNT